MRVFIDKTVHEKIVDFYEAAMQSHITLDEATVIRKIDRLYDAIESLGIFACIYPIARLKAEWIEKGYREFICEDFHFAFQIYTLEDGEEIVRVHDTVHSLLYH
jgi:hypothetical protein